jgi:hypothetical protein
MFPTVAIQGKTLPALSHAVLLSLLYGTVMLLEERSNEVLSMSLIQNILRLQEGPDISLAAPWSLEGMLQ